MQLKVVCTCVCVCVIHDRLVIDITADLQQKSMNCVQEVAYCESDRDAIYRFSKLLSLVTCIRCVLEKHSEKEQSLCKSNIFYNTGKPKEAAHTHKKTPKKCTVKRI